VAIGRRPLLVALRALGLGDLLTGVPALRALARAFPEYRRVLAAPAPLRPLVPAIDPGLELMAAAELEALPRALHGAEVAVNLHGRGPQSHRVLLAARVGRERRLWFGHADIAESRGAPSWVADEHERERWCRMLAEQGVPADPGDFAIATSSDALPKALVRACPTVIHPGAASRARRWPAERFAAVARAERRAGRAVVITGSPQEAALAREVASRAGQPSAAVLAGRTDLGALTQLIAAAGRVVSGDTGVAHLATALGTPSVVLFGPTSPEHWGPPANARHRALWKGAGGDPHAETPDSGLLRIEPGEVIEALAALPSR
jgi:ADP-heptose:LPS heptosyltransferase